MIRSPAGFDGGDRIKRYLDYYQPSYGVMMLSAGQFSPASLFASGEQGAWYDPSDMTTLFQDAAGTTPVTAVEQPVGLVLDKSKGLVLGSELVTNGDFSNGSTGWTVNTGWTISGGKASFSAGVGAELVQTGLSFAANTTYKITFDMTQVSGGGFRFVVDTTGSFVSQYFATTASHTLVFSVGATSTRLRLGALGGASFSIDNISVRELPGSHLSQSTAAARPVLSARVNLLTRTEEFDNAAWTKVNCTFLTGIITTTSTSDGLNQAITNYGSNASHSFTWRVSSGTATWLRVVVYQTSASANRVTAWFNVATGATGTAANGGTATGAALSVKTVSSGVYDITLSGAVNNGATGVTAQISTANSDASTTGVSGVTYGVQFADLRPSNAGVGLPSYQRVTTSTDYDTTGFPMYLRFDGTDDSMATGTINPGSVDKTQVFAGVRKLSDAGLGQEIVELSANSSANNGTFSLGNSFVSGTSNTYALSSRGTTNRFVVVTGFAAPRTSVLAGLCDIAADSGLLRENGAQIGAISGDQGTGNYLSYPLYIGRRGGTTLPFNGHLYSLIVRFSATNLPDATIAQTETWVNGKTGAY